MPLVSGLGATTYVATGLSTGDLYQFKVEARNEFGYSQFSETVAILAAQVPDKPAAPTTVFDRTTVQVSWTAPFNQGSTITGYRVYFQESDGVSFSEDLTDCNRLSVVTLTCTVPVSTFRASPF